VPRPRTERLILGGPASWSATSPSASACTSAWARGSRGSRRASRFEEIHARLPDYEVDEPGVGMVHTANVAGLATLPIRFTPSSS
jgi:hypothetical protein